MSDRLRVLVLSRAYPSDVLPTLGLWVEHPTVLLAERCDMRVVSPVPYCPPLPEVGRLREYVKFRRIPHRETRHGIEIMRPRFVVGPGTSLYAIEHAAYLRGVVRQVDRLRTEFPFDLIHAHFIYPDGVVAHRLARRYGVPFLVTEHAPWTGWLDRWRVAPQAIPAALAAKAILAVSTSVEKTIRAYAGSGPRVEVIPVGVDGDRFRLGTGPRISDQILFVGFLNRNKGVDVLLHALKLLEERGEPGRAVLVGGSFYRDTRVQEERLRRLARELDLDGRVSFAGRQPQAEVARLMAESAVVVLPSRAESFGAVLVEALACGTPVVATRSGGPEDIVTGDVGRLVPPDEPKALAEAIQSVLAVRERFPPEELRSYALSKFSWHTIVPRIEAEYLRAIGRMVGSSAYSCTPE